MSARTNFAAGVLIPAVCVAVTGCATSVGVPSTAAGSIQPSQTASPSMESGPTGRIVFVRFNISIDDDQVFVINADGTDERQLTPEPHQCPRWSPDGEWIAITGATAPAFIRPDGTDYREITNGADGLIRGCGTWSADGTRYVSESWDDNDPSRTGIYSFRVLDGARLRRITTPPAGSWDTVGDVSPDGSQLAFNRDGDLYLVNMDGTGERLLADGYGGAAWSPDGRKLLTDAAGSLFVIDVETGAVEEITSDDPAFTGGPYGAGWSPDGEWIVFSLVNPGPYADLYTMRLDGTQLRRLTASPNVDNGFGGWAD